LAMVLRRAHDASSTRDISELGSWWAYQAHQ